MEPHGERVPTDAPAPSALPPPDPLLGPLQRLARYNAEAGQPRYNVLGQRCRARYMPS